MEITKILHPLCKIKDAEVEVKISDEDGMSATSVETVIIGYSCEHHVEEVNKILKEVYDDERT